MRSMSSRGSIDSLYILFFVLETYMTFSKHGSTRGLFETMKMFYPPPAPKGEGVFFADPKWVQWFYLCFSPEVRAHSRRGPLDGISISYTIGERKSGFQ